MQARLWKSNKDQRPFFETVEPIDISLHSDLLTGLARFLPEEEFQQLLHECLEPDRSDAVKLVAVKALIILGQQVRLLFASFEGYSS